MDIPTIAQEIADRIMSVYAAGAIPLPALVLHRFVDVYEKLATFPSDDEHQQIADRVGALIQDR